MIMGKPKKKKKKKNKNKNKKEEATVVASGVKERKWKDGPERRQHARGRWRGGKKHLIHQCN
jgi:hypothetical protein